jgi:hypothetical protein
VENSVDAQDGSSGFLKEKYYEEHEGNSHSVFVDLLFIIKFQISSAKFLVADF